MDSRHFPFLQALLPVSMEVNASNSRRESAPNHIVGIDVIAPSLSLLELRNMRGMNVNMWLGNIVCMLQKITPYPFAPMVIVVKFGGQN